MTNHIVVSNYSDVTVQFIEYTDYSIIYFVPLIDLY